MDIFDGQTRTWQQGSPMSVPRKDFACGVIGDKIFVAGGEDWSLVRISVHTHYTSPTVDMHR